MIGVLEFEHLENSKGMRRPTPTVMVGVSQQYSEYPSITYVSRTVYLPQNPVLSK